MKKGIPLGRYVLGERIARGGMGEVYLGVQAGLGRYQKPLALKVLLPHLTEDEQAVRRFLEEAELAARMNHPNVVHIFDVGQEAGYYYLAMELVRGVALSRLIRALRQGGQQLPPELVAFIGRCLCEGLHHAHEQVDDSGHRLEIVHRDVTPQNVLVSVNGEVKLADFGIAKARDSQKHTQPGTLTGKFEYVAPEQAKGAKVDVRADIFGAGITLYELATLESPFRRENDAATLQALLTEPLPDPRLVRPELPAPLAEAILRAARKEPQERFGSARELRDALPIPRRADLAEELGRLVKDHCAKDVTELDARTAASVPAREESVDTASLTAPRGDTLDMPTQRLPGRRIWLGAAAMVVIVGAGALASAFGALGALGRASVERAGQSEEAVPAPESRGEQGAPGTRPSPAPALVGKTSAPGEPSRPAAPSTESRTPEAGPSRRSRASPARVLPAAQPAAPRIGYLNVDATPWATVSVNGQEIGVTPIGMFPLDEGLVTVQLVNAKTGRQVTRRVRIIATRPSFVRADLR